MNKSVDEMFTDALILMVQYPMLKNIFESSQHEKDFYKKAMDFVFALETGVHSC